MGHSTHETGNGTGVGDKDKWAQMTKHGFIICAPGMSFLCVFFFFFFLNLLTINYSYIYHNYDEYQHTPPSSLLPSLYHHSIYI